MADETKPRTRRERKTQTEWSVKELLDAKVPPVNEVVEGLLAVGLTMLAGRPKIGKSWLALQLAVAVAEGGAFLEQPVTLRGAVLYLALEDTAQRLKERVEIVRPRRDAPIRFITEWPALSWEAGGLGQLLEKIKVVKPKLVVIDTLASALQRGPAGAKAAEGLEVIVELRKMAHDCGCAVVAVDHHRKDGDQDAINDILGATSKSAAIDTAWGLFRAGYGAKLSVRGRDVQDLEIRLRFDEVRGRAVKKKGMVVSEGPVVGGLWVVSEDGNKLAAARAEAEILDALLEMGGRATSGVLAEKLGKSRQAVEKVAWRMECENRLWRRPVAGQNWYEVRKPEKEAAQVGGVRGADKPAAQVGGVREAEKPAAQRGISDVEKAVQLLLSQKGGLLR